MIRRERWLVALDWTGADFYWLDSVKVFHTVIITYII
jgi:hypothetical protein